MAATTNNRWGKVLADYKAVINEVWDMAFDGALSDSEALAANLLVKQYEDFMAHQSA